MKNKLFILLIITTFLTLPTPALAQSQKNQPGLLDSLGSGISQLLALNHPVHLDNPQNQFSLDQSPVFTLITPQKDGDEQITASITRSKGNKQLVVNIKKLEPGKFEISLQDPLKVAGDYILEITAKESFFYNRQISFSFSWGDLSKLSTQGGGGFMKSFLTKNPQYQKLPVVKRDKNSVHFQKPDGTIEANISAGPINFQNDKDQWQPIDTTLTQVGDELIGQGTPVKIKLDGTVEASGSAHSQKTIRFGWLDSSTGQLSGMVDLPLGKASGDQFIREGDFYKHILTLLDTGLKEELTLTDLPPNLQIATSPTAPRNDDNYLIIETEVTGLNLPDGWIEGNIKSGDYNFPLPTTKDATGKEISTKRFAKKVNGVQYIYTGITLTDLKTSAFPVTIDPDFASGTDDGTVWGQDAAYATAHSTANYSESNYTTLTIGQRYITTPLYLVRRAFLKFNTASIGSSATVTQVYLTMTTSEFEFAPNASTNIMIVEYDWSALDPATGYPNYLTAFGGCLAPADSILWQNNPLAGLPTYTSYASSNLTTSYVSKTGYTYYCLRSDADKAETTPLGNDTVTPCSADNTTEGCHPPTLTVTYTSPPVFQFTGLKMQGVKIQ